MEKLKHKLTHQHIKTDWSAGGIHKRGECKVVYYKNDDCRML